MVIQTKVVSYRLSIYIEISNANKVCNVYYRITNKPTERFGTNGIHFKIRCALLREFFRPVITQKAEDFITTAAEASGKAFKYAGIAKSIPVSDWDDCYRA